MEKIYVVINLGSSSKRYTIFADEHELFSLYFEKASSGKSYSNSIQLFVKELKKLHVNKIFAIAFRIVAPTSYFTQHRKINSSYLKKLKSVSQIAPLHTEPLINEIEQWLKIFTNISFYGISDSAFHSTLSRNAKIYALPRKITETYDIYRFGYHGISISSVINKVKKIYDNKLPKNIIVCHLSGGSSVTAIHNGKSVDTSMGFTPLEGIPMVNRVGNIDAAAILYLLEKKLKLQNLRDMLFDRSGMIGLTGITDMRKIIPLAQKGDPVCLEAIEIFVYSVIKYIGSYCAVLGNVDLLVFTGGIGECESFIRSLICKKLGSFGIILDTQKNNKILCNDGFINDIESKTKILVCESDEMREILLEMKKLVI